MPAMLLANPITEAKAKQQAAKFLAQRMHSGARRAPLKGGTNLTLAGQTKGYYAYNIGRGNGFVMMSASDRTQPILGYADKGQFNLSNAPQPLKQYVQLNRATHSWRHASRRQKVGWPRPYRWPKTLCPHWCRAAGTKGRPTTSSVLNIPMAMAINKQRPQAA